MRALSDMLNRLLLGLGSYNAPDQVNVTLQAILKSASDDEDLWNIASKKGGFDQTRQRHELPLIGGMPSIEVNYDFTRESPSGKFAPCWYILYLMREGYVPVSFEVLNDCFNGKMNGVTLNKGAVIPSVVNPNGWYVTEWNGRKTFKFEIYKINSQGKFNTNRHLSAFNRAIELPELILWALAQCGFFKDEADSRSLASTIVDKAPLLIACFSGILILTLWQVGLVARFLDFAYDLPFLREYRSTIEKVYDFLYPRWMKRNLRLVDDLSMNGMRLYDPVFKITYDKWGDVASARAV